jgi:2-polyprenyl-3-methyl-5-hydroxy-6-metoxy-1,4-benzoquinol methylase
VILCNHVCEHIPDDTKAMQNCIAFKTRRNGNFTNSRLKSKAVTFADDTITDQKERAKIFGQ